MWKNIKFTSIPNSYAIDQLCDFLNKRKIKEWKIVRVESGSILIAYRDIKK